jgi:hypothetical protein
VKLRFIPADFVAPASDAKATRVVAAPDRQQIAPKTAPIDSVTGPAAGRSGMRWALLALAIGAAVFFVLRGRA